MCVGSEANLEVRGLEAMFDGEGDGDESGEPCAWGPGGAPGEGGAGEELVGGGVLGMRGAVGRIAEIPGALDAIEAAQPQPSRPLSDPRAQCRPVTLGAGPHTQSLPPRSAAFRVVATGK